MPNDPEENESGAPGRRDGGLGKMPIVALLLVVVLAPAITWGVSEFVLLPRMRQAIAEGAEQVQPQKAQGKEIPAQHGKGKAPGEQMEANAFRFDGLVVNLAGTMGTRYLKTSFMVVGEEGLHRRFAAEEVQLRDAALSVLSSLSLADLEEVGARNFIRERLVRSFNQALGAPMAQQIYFLDFVVQ